MDELKTWPDGTPRLTKANADHVKHYLLKYYDLYQYHDDGELNVELTVALHEAYHEKIALKRFEKYFKGLVPYQVSNPTGRNEPCPCGSGKKYKKCHLETPETLLGGISEAEYLALHQKELEERVVV